MPACTLGCDELFERGYLIVDPLGTITINPAKSPASSDLTDVLIRLKGRQVQRYSASQEPVFKWHRDTHQGHQTLLDDRTHERAQTLEA